MPECGEGLWRRVISLNMSDPSQHCPTGWMENTTPARSCGCPTNSNGGCNQVSFPINAEYSRVCGRVTGWEFQSPDGFATHGSRDDENYVDGVSVTHSSPRQHIWTFAADYRLFRCPCDGFSSFPSFVGTNYFCDSTRNGAFWDGIGCAEGLSAAPLTPLRGSARAYLPPPLMILMCVYVEMKVYQMKTS